MLCSRYCFAMFFALALAISNSNTLCAMEAKPDDGPRNAAEALWEVVKGHALTHPVEEEWPAMCCEENVKKTETHDSQDVINKKVYHENKYQSDHWALQPYTLDDAKVIALVYFDTCEYAIYMNPTDKRGCRCIVRFIKNDDMLSTINRPYTMKEKTGLRLVVQMVEDVFSTFVPIVQTAVAGNNAHYFDAIAG